jgi:2,3-bisphosphoglycerate-dependent phosphoglycerate mutase
MFERMIEMTTVYFIRHAESDRLVRDGRIRPLTKKGWHDRELVTEFLRDKNIDIVLSSPFKRAVDTVSDFAEKQGFEVKLIEDFREQMSGSELPRDNEGNPFPDSLKRQWDDFEYRFSDGETLAELRERNINSLNEVLAQHINKNIVIGTHAMALSTIINYYDNSYGFKDFLAMNPLMPWVVKIDFNDDECIGMEKIDLFSQ